MNDSGIPKQHSQKKAVTVVGLMFAMFLIPYFYVIYIYKTGEIPIAETTETGTFFNPFIDMSSHSFQLYDGGEWNTDAFSNKWVILNFVDKECGQSCLEKAFNSQQAIVALTRYKGRVDQVILVHPELPGNEDIEIIIHLKKFVHGVVNTSLFNEVRQQLSINDSLSGYTAIVDPEAKLLLWYKPEAQVQDVLKDLKKLLKSSAAGYHGTESENEAVENTAISPTE